MVSRYCWVLLRYYTGHNTPEVSVHLSPEAAHQVLRAELEAELSRPSFGPVDPGLARFVQLALAARNMDRTEKAWRKVFGPKCQLFESTLPEVKS